MNPLMRPDGIYRRKEITAFTVSPRSFRYGVYCRGFLGKLWRGRVLEKVSCFHQIPVSWHSVHFLFDFDPSERIRVTVMTSCNLLLHLPKSLLDRTDVIYDTSRCPPVHFKQWHVGVRRENCAALQFFL